MPSFFYHEGFSSSFLLPKFLRSINEAPFFQASLSAKFCTAACYCYCYGSGFCSTGADGVVKGSKFYYVGCYGCC